MILSQSNSLRPVLYTSSGIHALPDDFGLVLLVFDFSEFRFSSLTLSITTGSSGSTLSCYARGKSVTIYHHCMRRLIGMNYCTCYFAFHSVWRPKHNFSAIFRLFLVQSLRLTRFSEVKLEGVP